MVANFIRPPHGRLLIEDQPCSGEWNMALDAALLDGALRRHEVILRIYRWFEPTLSLGHFQKRVPADFLEEPRRPLPSIPQSPASPLPFPTVRRLSGGGAILHHHEWTYSCVVPPAHRLAGRGTALYEAIHEALIDSLRELGIAARLRGESDAANPFLCFLRGDPRDILVAGHKVVGSAQRRRRGAVLQHGSVLLERSEFVPEIPGIFDLTAVPNASNSLGTEGFTARLTRLLFTELPNRALHRDDRAAAEKFVKTGATRLPRMDDDLR